MEILAGQFGNRKYRVTKEKALVLGIEKLGV